MMREEYHQAIQGAFEFAGSVGEAWNGLFILGLAIAGLKLHEPEPGTKIPPAYTRAPPPWAPDGLNSDGWSYYAIIVEHDFDPSVLQTQTIYN